MCVQNNKLLSILLTLNLSPFRKEKPSSHYVAFTSEIASWSCIAASSASKLLKSTLWMLNCVNHNGNQPCQKGRERRREKKKYSNFSFLPNLSLPKKKLLAAFSLSSFFCFRAAPTARPILAQSKSLKIRRLTLWSCIKFVDRRMTRHFFCEFVGRVLLAWLCQ